jgi:ABC-type antimicrobial peptide transport system permease subunit
MLAIGIVIGAILAGLSPQTVSSLLFGLTALLASAFPVIGVTGFASYRPARRASELQRMTALRNE